MSVDNTLRGRAARLALCVLLCYAAATVGGLGSIDAPVVYVALHRPPWAPPPWLFGPAWTLLYTLMAVALWQVASLAPSAARTRAMRLFLAQLAVNALWSWVFFAWRQYGWALAELVAMWLLIAATLVAFWRLRRAAGLLLVPYIGWVSFAGALNFGIWRLNPAGG